MSSKDKSFLIFNDRIIHLSSWIVFVFYFLIVYGLLLWSNMPIHMATTDALINSFSILISSYFIFLSYRYYLPKKGEILKILLTTLLFSLGCLGLIYYLSLQFSSIEELGLLIFSLPFRFIIIFLLNLAIMLVNIIRNLQEEYEENKARKVLSEKMLREAELYNLRQQLQPHFLFNSLNSIVALIGSQPKEARRMIFQLSDFLRGTIRKEENQFISLEKELKHIKLYLDIEKVRFGHRLDVTFDVAQGTDSFEIPSMIIQPILENAIKFGLYNVTGNVKISFNVSLEMELLMIQIENPFEQTIFEEKKGTGFGLASIQRRLFLLYSRTDLLKTSMTNNIFKTTLYIPTHDKNNIN